MAEDQDDTDPRRKRDYEVGYCKPPKQNRFKPGQSGNPKGRRKANRSFNGYVLAALAEKVTFTQDGKRQVVSKLQLIATQLVNSAIKGNLKSIEFVIRLMDFMDASPGSEPEGFVLSEDTRPKGSHKPSSQG